MRSMTGFGRGDVYRNNRRFRVELKAVNSRFLDIAFKSPRFLNSFEDRIRKRLSQDILRGKLEVWISFETNAEDDFIVSVNDVYANAYKNALEKLAEKFNLNVSENLTLDTLLKIPDILIANKFENISDACNMEEIWGILSDAIDEAVLNLNEMRQAEGYALANDIMINYKDAKKLIDEIKTRLPYFLETNLEKIKFRINEITSKLAINTDQERLLTEVAFQADKSDISEEISRLLSHFEQLYEMLSEEKAIGRKMDFLIQEMNRETNTIGAKSQSSELTNIAVELKSVIEKIREQAQNIE